MAIWITSDQHFNHENIIKYCKRPFHSVEQMNEFMIKKWNEKVGRDDLVIHLGDFGFGSVEKIEEIRKRLNGTIILLAGNHESYKKMKDCEFIFINEGSIQFRNIILSHRPLSLDKIPKGFVNVHGHIHEKESLHGINVGVDKTNFEPIELESLINRKSLAF
ncbi:MAG: metallophosphoesterase [Nanoarchaeota archaeon]